MSEFWKISILAVIQGITEFLPISSSGHLAVIGKFMNLKTENTVLLLVVLHAGTLLAIIIYYWKDIFNLLKPEGRKLIPWLILGTVPVGVIGIILSKTKLIDKIVDNPLYSGFGFFITGTILLFGFKKPKENLEMAKISWKETLCVGFAQSIAILPGVSRSGSTIASAMKLGFKRSDAAAFSFLLAIPAICGATFVKVLPVLKGEEKILIDSQTCWNMGAGFIISAIVGYFALALLINILNKNRFSIFAYYCYTAGILTLIGCACGII